MYIPKFRFKDKKTGERLYPKDVDKRNNKDYPAILALGIHGLPIQVDKDSFQKNEVVGWNQDHRYLPEQFSGDKDIHNIEIYAGDILTMTPTVPGGEIPDDFYGEVKFIEGGFYVVDDDEKTMFKVWQEVERWEIVGIR